MSQIALTPNAAGTGTFTIAAPGTNTNRTLTLPDATATLATTTDSITQTQLATALNASGSAPIYACRAWVNFNGTGTVAIRSSGNVSSITDGGTGTYTVNFTTAMPDTNYAFTFASQGINLFNTKTASTLQFLSYNGAFVLTDYSEISVTVFR